MEPTRIPYRTKLELALKSGCDPRTIQKVLDGEPCVGMARNRARHALEKAGLMPKPAATADAKGGQP